ncbi:endonuclease domain-containing protein [Pseudorhodoplanes sp.]|uniref:endonuclease domain-containing protein n=1 Tax=Pseudorhodoplanes sp. TaxID=1934341 RepID=UPI002C272E76|nr:endonuclease domain-containing protein [Pseudorhodoplanes sp.]HWV51101.1 endonuclease domain-containing protein [Pseudorhodoplanes sp.]
MSNELELSRRRDLRVPQARRLRVAVTASERKLWSQLKRLSPETSHFRRQAPIGPYFVDFACHALRLVIELDGGQHNQAGQMRIDQKRDAYLAAKGYRILRFWNNDVLTNIDGVLSVIADALASAPAAPPPTPDPSPPLRGGRGVASSGA